MTDFSEAWLRLREPVDAASRDPGLVAELERVMPRRPIHVVDLATGTAANLRYLSPLLGGSQTWRLIDRDRALLDAIPERLSAWADAIGAEVCYAGESQKIHSANFECEVYCHRENLAGNLAALDIEPESLITASALLDLVSEHWLDALVKRCRDTHATVLFALTFDGRIRFDPTDSEDALVKDLVNEHQRTDKGFGPALGPAASARAVALLKRAGYRVETARSDWILGPQDRELQNAMLAGYLDVATELAPRQASMLRRWGEQRRARIAYGQSNLSVGHTDLLGYPDR